LSEDTRNCNTGDVTIVIDKLLEAISFAAKKHKDQRNGVNAEPYINHTIAVA